MMQLSQAQRNLLAIVLRYGPAPYTFGSHNRINQRGVVIANRQTFESLINKGLIRVNANKMIEKMK